MWVILCIILVVFTMRLAMKENIGCRQCHVALAVDTKDLRNAITLVNEVKDCISIVKLGLEFFIFNGPDGVRKLHQETDMPIFLDLKLFDIPSTVRGAVESVLAMGCVSMLTVHLGGGPQVMNSAVEASNDKGLLLVGVTMLTSVFANKRVIMRLVNEAHRYGFNSIVCSAREVISVKKVCKSMITVVPGIRFEGSDTHDQYRTATPTEAVKNGADILVVGREITGSKDRRSAAQRIAAEVRLAIASDPSISIY
jgi:orotidine-5'-phosphate decarboxylase